MLSFLLSFATSRLILGAEERTFVKFMRDFNVYYVGDDYHLRLGIFATNLRRIHEFNKGNHSFRLGINEFMAWTPSELTQLRGAKYMHEKPRHEKKVTLSKNKKNVESWDWRDTPNIVGPIRAQGNCGACWAFSACAAQESQWAIFGNKWVELSVQNLVDCATNCHGCYGGWPSSAYDYVIENQNGHINKEAFYPYRWTTQQCKYDPQYDYSTVTGYTTITKNDEVELAQKVAELGPASICIDSSSFSFTWYTSGIFNIDECSTTFFDHAVNIVGFGKEGDQDYWIIRNSWNEKWGEKGYMRMIRGVNMCGVASTAIIPIDK
ncbi:Pro-cathepsin H [Tritrichomonas foetus]|uniref:Pro-cathepsin H n=1 Tax=Tritrichomonas foetus TaxID=1144522 RepID=A0A1J4J0F2_9EUKA|nr:Pro-cathepsin H [Tritrichomonas foetus]|eukprot:OHS93126.1 Pro-cathepsin H [Tritrichomonas foetus]